MDNDGNIMIISYKVKLELVEENSQLVKKVMSKLNELKPDGLQYASTIAEDSQTVTLIQKDISARCEAPPNVVSGSIVENYALF